MKKTITIILCLILLVSICTTASACYIKLEPINTDDSTEIENKESDNSVQLEYDFVPLSDDESFEIGGKVFQNKLIKQESDVNIDNVRAIYVALKTSDVQPTTEDLHAGYPAIMYTDNEGKTFYVWWDTITYAYGLVEGIGKVTTYDRYNYEICSINPGNTADSAVRYIKCIKTTTREYDFETGPVTTVLNVAPLFTLKPFEDIEDIKVKCPELYAQLPINATVWINEYPYVKTEKAEMIISVLANGQIVSCGSHDYSRETFFPDN